VRPLLIRAAGGLVWRDGPDDHELAVIHRPRHRDWSLPKGKLDPGESFRVAAVREVVEETGCAARPRGFAGFTFYLAKRRPKVVLYWHMDVEHEGPFTPNDEVDRLEWLSPADALARLDHAGERRLVARALRRVRPTPTSRPRSAPARSSGRGPSSS
jgi:8-oxo-dGTP diphosphatase